MFCAINTLFKKHLNIKNVREDYLKNYTKEMQIESQKTDTNERKIIKPGSSHIQAHFFSRKFRNV